MSEQTLKGRWKWNIHVSSKKQHKTILSLHLTSPATFLLPITALFLQLVAYTSSPFPHPALAPILKPLHTSCCPTVVSGDTTLLSQVAVLELSMPRDWGFLSHCSVANAVPAAPAPFVFLEHAKLVPASGPLPALLSLHCWRNDWRPLFTHLSTQMSLSLFWRFIPTPGTILSSLINLFLKAFATI